MSITNKLKEKYIGGNHARILQTKPEETLGQKKAKRSKRKEK